MAKKVTRWKRRKKYPSKNLNVLVPLQFANNVRDVAHANFCVFRVIAVAGLLLEGCSLIFAVRIIVMVSY